MNESETLELVDDSMESLAQQISDYIGANPQPAMMLVNPQSVTVRKKDGNFSKRPLIGGEQFLLVSCYIGKRNGLIYVFKPVDASDYAHMEMDEGMAKKALSGFDKIIKNVGGSEFDRFKKEAMNKASLDAERKKLAGREKNYGEMGFGSW